MTEFDESVPMNARSDAELDTGFRVLDDYVVQSDTHIMRIDIVSGGMQFHASCQVSIRCHNSLQMPAHLSGLSTRAASGDLIAMLRGLADQLEQQVEANVEAMKP